MSVIKKIRQKLCKHNYTYESKRKRTIGSLDFIEFTCTKCGKQTLVAVPTEMARK